MSRSRRIKRIRSVRKEQIYKKACKNGVKNLFKCGATLKEKVSGEKL